MVRNLYKENAAHLEAELGWLGEVMERRYHAYHPQNKKAEIFRMPQAPHLKGNSVYKSIVQEFKLNAAERLTLFLSLIPHIAPYYFDTIWLKLNDMPEGRSKAMAKPAAFPAVDLLLFLLAGDNFEDRFFYQQLFEENSFLVRHGIIILDADTSQPLAIQQFRISPDYLGLLTNGKPYKPRFSTSFPAKRITTGLEWKDLILNPFVKNQVEEIKSWIKYGKTILKEWELDKRLSPGYKVLFFGPPGTGKTLTAALLGKESETELQKETDVYRIDLSMVVSKYIGETEKNLSKIFDEAHKKDWILFFDEADALFGKRTEMKDAHDRYANQEVAFLLQKIEDHNGVVILSSNMRGNIDEAFTRRFQNIIFFPMPSSEERLLLWKNGFSKKSTLDKSVSLEQIAAKYEISGGAIMNVVRYASLKAMERKKNIIEMKDVMNGIAREFAKEGRTI